MEGEDRDLVTRAAKLQESCLSLFYILGTYNIRLGVGPSSLHSVNLLFCTGDGFLSYIYCICQVTCSF